MSRMVLDILRQAAEPLTSRDVALALLRNRGLDGSDPKLMRMMVKRAAGALRNQMVKGRVVGSEGPGQWRLWFLEGRVAAE